MLSLTPVAILTNTRENMTATGHALVGAAIGSQIGSPLIAIPIAFLSHFACDKVPHWDVMTDKNKSQNLIIFESIIDVFVSIGLVWLIFLYFLHADSPVNIFLCAFSAQLPDWMEVPYSIFKIKIPLVYDNYQIQSKIHDIWFDSRLKAPWGIVTQFVVVSAFVLWAIT